MVTMSYQRLAQTLLDALPPDTFATVVTGDQVTHGKPHPETGSTVVLTIAHMDQDPGNNDRANLRALCQRCHNRWDSAARSRNAAATRARKLGAGTLDLFTCEALP